MIRPRLPGTLKSRLVVAFLVMAVVPLSAIVAYSYASSTRAYRRAVAAEAGRDAGRLTQSMGAVRAAVARDLGAAGVHEEHRTGDGAASDPAVLARIAEELRGSLPALEALEFVPEGEGPTSAVVPPEPADAPDEPAHVVVVVPFAEDAAAFSAPPPPLPPDFEERIAEAIEAEKTAVERAAGRAARARSRADAEEARRRLENSVVALRQLSRERAEAYRAQREHSLKVLGPGFKAPVRSGEQVVGHLVAQVRPRLLLASILGQVDRQAGEIPFAVGRDGTLWTVDDADRQTLAAASIGAGSQAAPPAGWIVATAEEADSGLTFGIARRIGEGLQEIRLAAARNLLFGLALIALAGFGILPLSARLTADLKRVGAAAESLAAGDLSARAEVRSPGEVGALASAFNHMADELAGTQQRLVEQGVRERLLEADNERKGAELEAARRFQLSLLPARVPEHPEVELAVFMRTATEVGGDYYDFHIGEGGVLTVAVGDATGHGASAGTMVTVIKSLFTAAADPEPARFLADAAGAIRRMGLGRMLMALSLLRVEGRRLRVSSAGMPPLLVFRADTGAVEEVSLPAMPLGAFDGRYREAEVALEAGDTVLAMSDGLAELLDARGEQLGYERAREAFAAAAPAGSKHLLEQLAALADRWKDGAPPDDDVTFLVIRAR